MAALQPARVAYRLALDGRRRVPTFFQTKPVSSQALAFAAPGLRVFDPEDPTTALHQRYHDGTIQYTMDNMEWVERKGYSKDEHLTEEQKINVRGEARQRLSRFPRLLPQDIRHHGYGSKQPQRFSPSTSSDSDSLGDPGDNVFVISLGRRPEKLKRVLEHLQEKQLSAHVVTAVDGDAIKYQSDLEELGVRILPGYESGYSNHNMPFTTGEVGCFLSHYTIWHYMVEQGISSALILEDDFELQEDFQQRLGDYLSEAQGLDWNLMYVGRSPMENDVSRISEHVVEPGYTLWTVGYILRLEGAVALLDSAAEQHMVPLDDFFSVSMGRGKDGSYNERAEEWSHTLPPILRGLGTNPPLVMPYVGSMFLSDTAMLREGTRYVSSLPLKASLEGDALSMDPQSQSEEPEAEPADEVRDDGQGSWTPMPQAWREALDSIEALYARAAAAQARTGGAR
ncbi:unnamed protein product [Polarella glacialis]|uniref:Glycosyl transferase family 25 domain-containing protein n=1 Tax=Polarella glacialis TaxID=89957 RepID=A0A813HEK5_POLGL|nr:unnamed protein product [Polarella glacialis]